MTTSVQIVADSVRDEFERRKRARDWPACRELALSELTRGGDLFWCLAAFGLAEWGAGNRSSALSIFQAAARVERDCPDLRAKGAFNNNLAMLYRALGRVTEAEVHYRIAADYFRECGEGVLRAAVLNNLAFLQAGAGKGVEAVDNGEEARATFRMMGDHANAAEACRTLADAYEALAAGDSRLRQAG